MAIKLTLKDLERAIPAFEHRYRACLAWYEEADEDDKEYCKSMLSNARYWLDMRNQCVKEVNQIMGKTVYEQYVFPYEKGE